MLLISVHVPVSEVEDLGEGLAFLPFRNANAEAYVEPLQSACVIPVLQGSLDAGYDRGCADRIGIGEDNQEFVASISDGDVRASNRAFQHGGNLGKDEIAGEVAELRIYLFETVDVDQEESQRGMAAARLADETADQFFHGTAVVNFGERVGKGLEPNEFVLHGRRDRLLAQAAQVETAGDHVGVGQSE